MPTSEILPSEFCPVSVDWEEFEIPNWDVPKEILLNAPKYQGCSFYCFSVIKGKLPSPPRLFNIIEICSSNFSKCSVNRALIYYFRWCPLFVK